MKKKQLINVITGGLAALFGVAAMITQLIADKDDREDLYNELEDRYGLEPGGKKETKYLVLTPDKDDEEE